MNTGMLAATSGMKAQMEALDVLANNLANMNTAGFKEQRSFFSILSGALDSSPSRASAPEFAEKPIQASSVLNLSDGLLHATNRDLDLALVGDGFLTLRTPRGIRYTRNGNLSVNARSELAAADGSAVLGEKGPIVIGAGKLTISEQGEVVLDGKSVDRLKVVSFANPQRLVQEGGSQLAPVGVDAQPERGATVIMQGYLEQSNVNAVASVVEMVAIMRRFEAIQKSVNILLHDLDAKSIEKLGR